MGIDSHHGKQESVTNSGTAACAPVQENASRPLGGPFSSQQTLNEPSACSTPDANVQVGRRDSKKMVTFTAHDQDNPYNWSERKKHYILFAGIVMVINSTLESSLPSGAIEYIAKDFNITSEVSLPLPISCFLMGYVIGPTLCGPLSEQFGRYRVMLGFFLLATIFTLACAVAPNWSALLVFRFFSGIGASGPIAIVGGLYADIYNDPRQRGRALAWFMVATTTGPVAAPPISGFIAENTSWRWVFGFGALFAAATIPFVAMMPETYGPTILSRKAAKLRKETGDPEIVAKSDMEEKDFKHLLSVVMTRPYRMLFQEVIVMCVCVYVSLAYGIFYIYFEAYPIIFQGSDSVYKWSPGIAGLAFLPISIGAACAAPIFLWWDSYLAKSQARGKAWAKKEEYRRLPLACLAGPLYVTALFWLGWSARSDMHWLAPVASGVPFGIAFLLIFMALLNYLTDAYETFAASAQGIASTCRSIFGAVLPLAGHRMFSTLGIAWSCSLLAFLSLGVSVIPFVFIWYGEKIRANSKFCQHLKEMKAKEAAEQDENERTDGQGTTPEGDCVETDSNVPNGVEEKHVHDKV